MWFTAYDMSITYVDTYNAWKEADKIIIVGFGFGADDEHINGIIRNLIDKDGKKIEVIMLKSDETESERARKIAMKLKTPHFDKIKVVQVDNQGKNDAGKMWTEII